ncbi:MAG TPA: efflux RND transporter periplasmic adaptor subunit [Steroidobacteraceae bacterium]
MKSIACASTRVLLSGLALAAAASFSTTASAATPSHAAGLATVTLGQESAPAERMLDGTVESVHQATLSAQTASRVAEIPTDVNDRVAKGDVLLRLRGTEQAAGLSEAQAALQAATARELEAQSRYVRISDMYTRKVVARATFDEATASRDTAVAQLQAARAGVEAAREGVSYTELRAPYAGVVTQKLVQVGEAVGPGTPLMAVAALDALRVVTEIPQSIVEQVRASKQATVHVGNVRVASTAITVFPSADPQTNTFRARIDVPANTPGLAPGMLVKVGVATGERQRLTLPRSAVVERSEMRAVYVVAKDGSVTLRQVRLGHEHGERIDVLAGLVAGEAVALDPVAAGLQARQPAPRRD